MGRTLFHDRGKGLPALGIDDLEHPDQFLGLRIHDRHHQHLLGAIPGLYIHLLQKIKLRTVRLEFLVIVYVADVDHLLMDCDKTGDTLLRDRQLQVFKSSKAGLDL